MYCLKIILVPIVMLFLGCKKNPSPTPAIIPPLTTDSTVFAKGADISWVTQMENARYNFYDSNTVKQDCFVLLKSYGINSIRLRAWVNPVDGWCNTADLLAKALRAKTLGLKIMIDFHYSDSWADPGQQNKPAAWQTMDIDSLVMAVYNYTYQVMDTLKQNGISPEWAQTGNETNDGMLWEDGRASTHFHNFSRLLNSGYSAVKAVDTATKVIIHISNGFDNNLFRWMFDSLKSNGTNWDVIGMSLYPETNNWQLLDDECLANMNDMVSRYNKEVMVCEVGMDASDPADSKSFLLDIIAKTKLVTGGKGLGVFYWEPESYNWQGYTKGAFDNSGRPTIAMDAFKN